MRRKGRAASEKERAASDQKWEQIRLGIATHNACCNEWDAEYWEPDAFELMELHSMWDLRLGSDRVAARLE